LYPQEKVLLPIQNCGFVSSIRKNELTRDTDAQPLWGVKSASLGAICVVVSSHCELCSAHSVKFPSTQFTEVSWKHFR